MAVFAMPSLGADMEAGKLVEWLVKPGDTVKRGDVVAVVETQKGAIEIEIFEDGTVESLTAGLGDELPVGAPLAVISNGAAAPPQAPQNANTAPINAPQADAAPPPQPQASAAPARPEPPPGPPVSGLTGAPDASPAARLLARERGIDLSILHGSGPNGAVVLADVEAAGRPAAQPSRRSGFDPGEMRAAIAAAMARSKREIPHYYLNETIDLQPASDWLASVNAARPPDTRLLMGALFVKAVSRAAKATGEVNGFFEDGTFRASKAIHAGVAVALRGGGLIAPAIHDSDGLALDDLMAAMRDLVTRARSGRLRSSEMSDATLTVSSMGESGADTLTGVIFPPQVALIGIGAPRRRPWLVEDRVVPRQVVTVTLAADHRVSDGRKGARFLAEIDRLLKLPEEL
jgi:pyruvate dehydrogenase E2 component (dihydrolipoamide acetyltransferase)